MLNAAAGPSTRRFSTVADVRVPDGVAPGASFKVTIQRADRPYAKARVIELWRASGLEPAVQARCVEPASGLRHRQRPEACAARAAGRTGAKMIDEYSTVPAALDASPTTVELPFETKEDDIGWLPGPVNGSAGRAIPTFTGKPMGAANHRWSAATKPSTIMKKVHMSDEYVDYIHGAAAAHAAAWQEERGASSAIERAWNASHLKRPHYALWLTAHLRVCRLNPAIAAKVLWTPGHSLYDRRLDAAIPYDVYRWQNRHYAFGSSGGAADDDESESDASESSDDELPTLSDRHRKRRDASNLCRSLPCKAFHPHQHLGFDDLIRVTRHLDAKRQRHKAAVHSGVANEALSCCHSSYFINWEERGWIRNQQDHDAAGISARRLSADCARHACARRALQLL